MLLRWLWAGHFPSKGEVLQKTVGDEEGGASTVVGDGCAVIDVW